MKKKSNEKCFEILLNALKYFRNATSRISRDLQKNQSANENLGWNYLFRHSKCNTLLLCDAKSFCQFVLLLYGRFQKWCTWIATSNMVSLFCVENEKINILILDFAFKRLPFDTKNLVGYPIAVVMQVFIAIYKIYDLTFKLVD